MQPRTTLTINEIINEIANEITNEIINEIINFVMNNKEINDKKNNSSKLCQKSSTNPQRWIFTSSRFMLSMTCCILLWAFCFASMKVKCSIWTTHDFHEDRFCHQDFLWMTDFVTKTSTPKLRHQNFDTKKFRHQNFDTKTSTPKFRHQKTSTPCQHQFPKIALIYF